MSAQTIVPDLTGAAAIPRSNGELIFESPWQGRVFGLVVHLHQSGLFEWDEFKELLIAEIDSAGIDETCDPSVYYRQFTAAFIRLMVARGVLDPSAIDARTAVEKLVFDAHSGESDHGHSHSH